MWILAISHSFVTKTPSSSKCERPSLLPEVSLGSWGQSQGDGIRWFFKSLNFLMSQCLNVMYSHGGSGEFALCSRLRFRPGWPRGLEGEVRERYSSFISWGGKGLREFRLWELREFRLCVEPFIWEKPFFHFHYFLISENMPQTAL